MNCSFKPFKNTQITALYEIHYASLNQFITNPSIDKAALLWVTSTNKPQYKANYLC